LFCERSTGGDAMTKRRRKSTDFMCFGIVTRQKEL
jgi:hypothetical protein